MNFNPNTIMKQKIQQMISQRFGSVDNMMNDMSKFAGNNPTLKNALDLYKHGDSLNNTMQSGFNGMNVGMLQGFNGVQQAINADTVAGMQNTNTLQSQLANCCCETREAIQGINYNLATNTCALQNTMNNNTRDLLENQNSNTRAILDFLTNDKIATLQAENSDLKRAASQDRQSALLTTAMASQTQQLINAINPAPIPAFQVPAPYAYAGCNTYGNGCC